MAKNTRLFNLIKYGIIVGVSLLPIIRLAIFLATTGANNISGDNLQIVPLIDQMLGGSYSWRYFFHDVFINGHFQAGTVLVQFIIASIASWDVFWLLGLGLIFAVVKWLLIYDSFTCFFKNKNKILLLPILSALVFSPSQISTFEFDWNAIMDGLSFGGFALGIWGLVKFPGRWLGVSLMAIGGVVASWSSGSGPLVWPAFLVGLLLLKYRRATHYLVLVFTGIVTTAPYFIYTFLISNPKPYDTPPPKSFLFKYLMMVQSVGWPFAQGFSLETAFSRGVMGWVLCLSGLGILMAGGIYKKIPQASAPALILITYGILSILQISIFRDGLSPWYASKFMVLWIGLLGLAFLMLIPSGGNHIGMDRPSLALKVLPAIWAVTLLVTLIGFYLTSNLSYADKSYFLQFRSPVSNSCLRNYKTAPTYCEWYLYSWQLDRFEEIHAMAEPLERNRLSVFAPRQKWALQGDFILNNVQLHEFTNVPDIFWSVDKTNIKAPFYDYRHLSLFLHSPNFVEWKIVLPKNLDKAVMHSAVMISESAPKGSGADGLKFEVSVEPEGEPREIFYENFVLPEQRYWQPFSISLIQFSGQTITLRFSSSPGGNITHDWGMFRYPYIDLILEKDESSGDEMGEYRPSNVDSTEGPNESKTEDIQLGVNNPENWVLVRMQPAKQDGNAEGLWEVGADPFMEYKPKLNLCLADYSKFYVKMAVSKDISFAAMQIYYKIDGQERFLETHSILMPILADDETHSYTYDLKLLEEIQHARLTGIRLDPVMDSTGSQRNWVKISDFRFIRGNQPSACH